MSFEDDEIVQDFLVEAGEILEQLGEQLVELEQSPSDSDLLNAVFRGFHTIKGGASFIHLTALVEVCHVAEDVFNQLRQGEREVDANLMDIMLQVLDVLNDMFDSVRAGEEPESAEPALIANLKALLVGREAVASVQVADPAPTQTTTTTDASAEEDNITDQEFEKLLDVLDEEGGGVAAASDNENAEVASSNSDDISEEEFDQLLDDLHGKGKFSATANEDGPASSETSSPESTAAASDEITEEEFDNLLDDLHGKGKFSASGNTASSTEASSVVDAVATTPQPVVAAATPQPQAAVASAAPAATVAAEAGNAARVIEESPVAAPEPAKKPEAKKPAAKDAAPQGDTTVRVDTKRLDDIMNMVGELVLVRNRLVTIEASLGNEEVSQAASNLDLVTADLQTAVMKTRMQPIKKVFGRFPRVVRDLARSLKKEVSLVLQGEETDLDKNLVEALADPLVHLVRNAVDHGIEMPDVREEAGKDRNGTVLLSAQQEGDHILLIIKDDGGGMDPDKLRQIAVDKGVMDEESAARLDDKEAFGLIFAPGFSTKVEISDISGRGVGMDVVKTRIVQLNGTVDIDSMLGQGTTLSIKVPLTLAIMPTLMVMLGNQIFALPLVSVSEIFNLNLTETNKVDGQEVIMLRDQPLPIYYLKDWLVESANGEAHPKQGHVVVVSVGNQKAGFVVEQLIGQEEVVIKPLGKMLQGTQGLSGATITGDGRIALILDVPSLMNAYAKRY